MKFLNITTYHVDKLGDLAKALDKLAANPPEDYKILHMYSCLANPFPGVELPQGTMIGVSIIESDNAEALASTALELTLAGATVNRVPVLEVSTGEVEDTVEKLKV
jgi:hypothetical protein